MEINYFEIAEQWRKEKPDKRSLDNRSDRLVFVENGIEIAEFGGGNHNVDSLFYRDFSSLERLKAAIIAGLGCKIALAKRLEELREIYEEEGN